MSKLIPSGTVTSPRGFLAGAVEAGIRSRNRLDLAILCSEVPSVAAGVFTANRVKAAPVILSHQHLSKGKAQAIVANSGCANACVGEQGLADAVEMASLTATRLEIPMSAVLVASTGVIGAPLPMERIRRGIKEMTLHPRGGHDFAKAIMTTDSRPKEVAAHLDIMGARVTIAGVAKGSGMIHPNMATMLCFLTTDASVDAAFLRSALRGAVDVTFNMVSVDGETSPSDSVFLLANGLAGGKTIDFGNGEPFRRALNDVCLHLAKAIAQDGEGATKLLEVLVEGARHQAEARQAARTIVSSPLVKAAVHGSDPNWGRIASALGRSAAEVVEEKLDLYLNRVQVMERGRSIPFDEASMRTSLQGNEVSIHVRLNLGDGKATAWGCDLSEEYVTINSAYTT